MGPRFKTLLISALLSSSAIVSVAYLSCNRDKCKTIVCANGGVCNGGSCTCVDGYEGVNCGTATRNKFMGSWTVFEKGSYTKSAQYVVTIDTGAIITEVVIHNFNNFFTEPVVASVYGDVMTINTQNLQGKRVFGVGTITPNTTYAQDDYMVVPYEVVDSASGVADDYGYNLALTDGSGASQWNKD